MRGTKPSDFQYKCPSGYHRHRSEKSAKKCVYCRRNITDDFKRSAKRWFNNKQYKIPENCHPAVAVLFGEMKAQKITYKEMKKRSGIDTQTLRAWRTRTTPTIDNLEACLNVLELTLLVGKKPKNKEEL